MAELLPHHWQYVKTTGVRSMEQGAATVTNIVSMPLSSGHMVPPKAAVWTATLIKDIGPWLSGHLLSCVQLELPA